MSKLYCVVKKVQSFYMVSGITVEIIGVFKDKNKAEALSNKMKNELDLSCWDSFISIDEVETDLF